MPGLQARSPVGGVGEATDQYFSLSLSPSFPLCLKINIYKLEKLWKRKIGIYNEETWRTSTILTK